MLLMLAFAGLTTLRAADPAETKKPEAATAPAKELKLPGLEINKKEHSVDVDAVVCLVEGALELIACTKGTKEHEAIIVVEALPIHIHAGLLLLGAKNGNPAMRHAINKEQTRWVDVPPKGDPVDVSLVWKDDKGVVIERPISDFIERREEFDGNVVAGQKNEKQKFPSTFLFAGSLLGDASEKPRRYLAQDSGNVISIATFGDEVLCLPDVYSHENGALNWQIDSTHLPKLQSKVTLRLRVKKAGPKP